MFDSEAMALTQRHHWWWQDDVPTAKRARARALGQYVYVLDRLYVMVYVKAELLLLLLLRLMLNSIMQFM